jgi:hypothetical protein
MKFAQSNLKAYTGHSHKLMLVISLTFVDLLLSFDDFSNTFSDFSNTFSDFSNIFSNLRLTSGNRNIALPT